MKAIYHFFVYSFTALTFLCFLSVSADSVGHIRIQFLVGILSLTAYVFLFFNAPRKLSILHGSLIFFALFVLFQWGRAIWAGFEYFRHPEGELKILLKGYLTAPIGWSFFCFVFMMSYSLFHERSFVERYIRLVAFVGVFIALNAIAPALGHHQFGFVSADQSLKFFYPPFYFHPWVGQYFLAVNTHPNHVGDIIALGFFPSCGLLLYHLYQAMKRKHGPDKNHQDVNNKFALFRLILPLTFILVMAGGILAPLSRGSILAFVFTFTVFLIVLFLKIPSRQWIMTIACLLIGLVSFLMWSIGPKKVIQELKTIQSEFEHVKADPNEDINIGFTVYSVREGFRIALLMYQDYPFFGIGTKNFELISNRYARKGKWEMYQFARFSAMSHYLHLLAEEGVGVFFYSVFLIFYFLEAGWKLLWVKSRFQFIAALSFMMPVLMIFVHAAANDLMQRFSTSVLVYAFMGASLSLLRKDFLHHLSTEEMTTHESNKNYD